MQAQHEDPDFAHLAINKMKAMQEAPPYDAKKSVWVVDEKEGYCRGEIQSTKGDEVVVQKVESKQVSIQPTSHQVA